MKKYKDARYILFFNYTMIRRRTRHLHISISCWIGSCKVSISSVEVEKAVIALVIHRSKGKMSVNWNPVSPTCIHHSSLFVVIVYNEHTFFPNATCGEILRVYGTQTLPLVRKIMSTNASDGQTSILLVYRVGQYFALSLRKWWVVSVFDTSLTYPFVMQAYGDPVLLKWRIWTA